MCRLGYKHSEETKEKIRQKRILYFKTHDNYWKDKHLSEEIKKKISDRHKGKKLTMSHRENISQGLRKAGRWDENNEEGRTRMTWKEWRKAVLERDKFLCQLCFSDSGLLVAHHIVPFKTNISLRFEVENGLTLCRKCHADLHNFSLLTKKAVNCGKLQLLSKLLKALDNPQPSESGNTLEGSTTNGESHRDNNSDTSAAAEKKARDSLSFGATQRSDV